MGRAEQAANSHRVAIAPYCLHVGQSDLSRQESDFEARFIVCGLMREWNAASYPIWHVIGDKMSLPDALKLWEQENRPSRWAAVTLSIVRWRARDTEHKYVNTIILDLWADDLVNPNTFSAEPACAGAAEHLRAVESFIASRYPWQKECQSAEVQEQTEGPSVHA